MFYRCKDMIRSINGQKGFGSFVNGLHSEAHIGTPNIGEDRRDLQGAKERRTLAR